MMRLNKLAPLKRHNKLNGRVGGCRAMEVVDNICMLPEEG